MKKFLVALVLLCASVTYAGTQSIKNMVFFGDSLSDNGNLYRYLLSIPKSPPYFKGRFTNGPTWAENVGDYYHKKYKINYSIYAVGGATAIIRSPFKGAFPITLEEEVYDYLIRSAYTERTDTLFILWMGANDYMDETAENVNTLSSEVVDQIAYVINILINHGARNFMVFNLPDLSKSPFAISAGQDAMKRLEQLTELNNEKLSMAIADLKQQHKDVNFTLFDANTAFSDIATHPEKYNKLFNLHITNTTQSCWLGGLTFKQEKQRLAVTIGTTKLYEEMQEAILQNRLLKNKNISAQSASSFILHSPSLAEAYTVGKLKEAGIAPCSDPDSYLFWDKIHPTKVGHQIFSSLVEQAMAG